MIFAISAAVLTLVMLAIVFWPALRGAAPNEAGNEHEFDLAIYKDQMREVDADLERGAINAEQADYARAEIGRRLLAAEDAVRREGRHPGGARVGVPVLVAAALFVPVAAGVVYSMTGSPGMQAEPLASRKEQERQVAQNGMTGLSVEDLVKKAEDHLAKNPKDGRGWDVLAPMYLRLGRPDQAAEAFKRAMVLVGESAPRQSGLGQAYYMMADGQVDDKARQAFNRALELEPGDARARFFLALGDAQSGEVDKALSGWTQLADDESVRPEWRAAAREGLNRFGAPVASAPEANAPALDQQTMQDAQQMSPEDRRSMIEGMVGKLDAKLRENPDDVAGWQRLIRSYAVLGRKEDAADAANRALAAFKDDDAKRKQITAFLAEIGMEKGSAPAAQAPQANAPALDQQTMQDAQQMSPEDRQSMIEGMVAQLDAKLRDNPDDVAGWERLIRSYAVLGRKEDAADAAKRALSAFKDNEAKKNQIAGFIAALGIPAGESAQQ